MSKVPNMENKLALIWRENVMKLMAHYSFDLKDMVNATGRGFSTIAANFGGNIMKAAPSLQTIHIIERAFNLNKGTLNKAGWKPQGQADMENPKNAPTAQLASINLPIPAHKLARILRILEDDDD